MHVCSEFSVGLLYFCCSKSQWTRLFCHVKFVLQRPLLRRYPDVSLAILTSPRYIYISYLCFMYNYFLLNVTFSNAAISFDLQW